MGRVADPVPGAQNQHRSANPKGRNQETGFILLLWSLLWKDNVWKNNAFLVALETTRCARRGSVATMGTGPHVAASSHATGRSKDLEECCRERRSALREGTKK
jgi:hypothetical protein